MESIIIIIIGLVFSALSKSAKQSKEVKVEKERKRRQMQAGVDQHSQTKSLREIFMEELKKIDNDQGGLGDLLKKSFNTEDTKEEEISSPQANYNKESDYVTEQEYLENEGYRYKGDKEKLIIESVEDKNLISPGSNYKNIDNRQYSPFSKSLNKKDIIRGIIFSEVIDKPKALRKRKEA